MVSTITPPVALAAFAGASLAGADPMRTGFAAVKLGTAAFIVTCPVGWGWDFWLVGFRGGPRTPNGCRTDSTGLAERLDDDYAPP